MRFALDALLPPGAAEQLIAGSPSFDVSLPHVPGRSFEGVHNAANMKNKIRDRLLTNPQGQEALPQFLKSVRGV